MRWTMDDEQLINISDLIAQLSDGNIGALTVLTKIFKWDVKRFFELGCIMQDMNIPGWWVWLAYKEYAEFDLELTCRAIIKHPDEFMKLVERDSSNQY